MVFCSLELSPLFLNLLQVAIGTNKIFYKVPSEEEWNQLFLLTAYQGVQSICALALSKKIQTSTGENALMNLPKPLLRDWIAYAMQLEKKNQRVNKECAIVEYGIRMKHDELLELERQSPQQVHVSILKGQGVARFYRTAEGKDLSLCRESGDIDIWISGGWQKSLKLARYVGSMADFDYKHIHIPVLKQTKVELHWRPVTLTNLIANYRLQSFFDLHQGELYGESVTDSGINNSFHSPTIRMNRILLLTHSYAHFVGEGLRMKQLLDFYFLVKQPITSTLLKEEEHLLCLLHLKKFASAMAWVMYQIDSTLDVELLPAKPNEKEGRFLFEQVLSNGNPDTQKHQRGLPSSRKEMIVRWWNHAKIIMPHYPSEILWWPLWKATMFLWKRWALVRSQEV